MFNFQLTWVNVGFLENEIAFFLIYHIMKMSQEIKIIIGFQKAWLDKWIFSDATLGF